MPSFAVPSSVDEPRQTRPPERRLPGGVHVGSPVQDGTPPSLDQFREPRGEVLALAGIGLEIVELIGTPAEEVNVLESPLDGSDAFAFLPAGEEVRPLPGRLLGGGR